MVITKMALMKIILASCLLSSVMCDTSITLTNPATATTCTTGTQIIIIARAAAGGTNVPACVPPANTIYTGAKGCAAYVVTGGTVASIPTTAQTATGLTCDVGVRLEDGSSTCATTGYIKIKVKAGSNAVYEACIDPTNPTYLTQSAKGCGYFSVDSAAISTAMPYNSLTLSCAGGAKITSLGSGCTTGYTKVRVKPGTGTIYEACVNNLNSFYLTQLAKGCSYYSVDTGAISTALPFASETITCAGVSLTDASSGCASGFTKIKVKTSTGTASAFGCVNAANPTYIAKTPVAEACGFFTLAASVSVSPFPIVSDDLTCGGVQVTAVGSGCGTGQTLISVRTSSSGQSTNVCVKDANDVYTAAGTSCQYYLLDSTTNLGTLPANSDTMGCGGLVLKAVGSGCGSTEDTITVRKSATGASTSVCVEKTNTAYTGAKAKGCSYFVVSSTTNLDLLPAKTDSLTCGGATFTALSGSCAAGSTQITVKVGTTASNVCVIDTNAVYLAESKKGCAYYTVTSATASDTMTCGGATFTSSCTAGVQTSIPLRTTTGGTSTNYCVKNINPAFLAAGPNCQFYLVSATTSSDTLDCSGVGSLTALESGACPSGKVLLTIKDSSGASTQACYPESDGLYAVQNCDSYLVTVTGTNSFPTLPLNTTTLTCTCGSTTTLSAKSLVGTSRKACIPNTQWRVNCDTYKKTSVGQYSCSVCQQGANFIVPLGKDAANGNPKNYTDACTPAKVPGCQTYKIFLTTATAFDGAGTAYDNAVGCETCLSGYTAYAAATTTHFLFWSTTQDQVGKACPLDGTITATNCNQTKLVNGAYSCSLCASANGFMTNYYDASSKLTPGCLLFTDGTTPYKNTDKNCDLFSWGDADLHTNFTCIRCKLGYLLKTVYDSDGTTTFKRCVPQTTFITSNCKDLIAADLTIASPVYACFKCVTGYTQLNVAVVSGSIYSVLCAKTGRFSLISTCTKYDPTMNLDLVFGLTCSTCSGGGSGPSCTSPCTPAGAFAAKNSQTPPADICVKTNFVDNCAQYATTAATSSTGNTGDNDCVKCAAGYTNVTTSATTISGGKAIICINDTQKIANCNIYNHADLACYDCKDKLGFDRNTWKCRGPTDVSASCTKGVMVGDKLVCITCPIGYTLKDGACVTAVPFCASLSSTGVCSACVQPNNYQLINNKCILKPANCATVDENGACTACKPGFLLTVDKACAVTSSNTCPAGQFLSNGVCVTGTIANCQNYDRNGKCETCKTGFTLSTNGKECTASSSGSSSRYPNAPPCPADTNKFRYVRNPSDPNGPCVPVDVQCANPRDDGHCISCKDGEFAHTDGLCYKIVFPSN